MRAAGLPAGYLSKHLVPEGSDPSSMTPFYDRIRARDPQEPDDAPKGEKEKKAAKDGEIDAGAFKPGATDDKSGGSGSARFSGGIGGGGALTMEQLLAMRKQAGGDLDEYQRQGIAGIKDVEAAKTAAAEENAAGLEALYAGAGQSGARREKRLQEEIDAMPERRKQAKGDAFIHAGLAMMTAPPGSLTAIIAGAAQKGILKYDGDDKALRAEKAKLDDSMDLLMEARRVESLAQGKDKLLAKANVKAAKTEAAQQTSAFMNLVGLEKYAKQPDAMVKLAVESRDHALNRNATLAAASMRSGSGGSEDTAGMKPKDYEAAVDRQAKTIMTKTGGILRHPVTKQIVTDPEQANALARELAKIEIAKGSQTGMPSTSGFSMRVTD